MIWYGMVWYGMVWYGMVWYGMVYDMVWIIWCNLIIIQMLDSNNTKTGEMVKLETKYIMDIQWEIMKYEVRSE